MVKQLEVPKTQTQADSYSLDRLTSNFSFFKRKKSFKIEDDKVYTFSNSPVIQLELNQDFNTYLTNIIRDLGQSSSEKINNPIHNVLNLPGIVIYGKNRKNLFRLLQPYLKFHSEFHDRTTRGELEFQLTPVQDDRIGKVHYNYDTNTWVRTRSGDIYEGMYSGINSDFNYKA